ncbi:MAG: DUF4870 domain-containing protein [Planctomycetota bacterium]
MSNASSPHGPQNPYSAPLEHKPMTAGQDSQTQQWALILHLSQFAGYAIPLLGLIAPIVIWQIKKNELPSLDAHGRVVANWMISEFIYFLLTLALCLVVVGFFLLPVLAILSIVFPIVGAVKASQGEVWKYPGSIPFFRV